MGRLFSVFLFFAESFTNKKKIIIFPQNDDDVSGMKMEWKRQRWEPIPFEMKLFQFLDGESAQCVNFSPAMLSLLLTRMFRFVVTAERMLEFGRRMSAFFCIYANVSASLPCREVSTSFCCFRCFFFSSLPLIWISLAPWPLELIPCFQLAEFPFICLY